MSSKDECATCSNAPKRGEDFCEVCKRIQALEATVEKLNKQVAMLTKVFMKMNQASWDLKDFLESQQ